MKKQNAWVLSYVVHGNHYKNKVIFADTNTDAIKKARIKNIEDLQLVGDLEQLYLDWFNNFLTLERFAEYYKIHITHAQTIIERARKRVA
jgi:hypothetical protein